MYYYAIESGLVPLTNLLRYPMIPVISPGNPHGSKITQVKYDETSQYVVIQLRSYQHCIQTATRMNDLTQFETWDVDIKTNWQPQPKQQNTAK